MFDPIEWRCLQIELYTFEEMQDREMLCDHCRADPGCYQSPSGDPIWCEGAYCDEAYQSYLDNNEITETVVKIKNKTKVTIKTS